MRFYDPYREMETLRREIDRVFNTYGQGTGTGFTPSAFLPGRAARNYPLINLSEDRDNVYIEALAPGVNPETLNLTVQGNMLTISGEKPAPQGVEREAFHRSERAAGKFLRTVELPTEVDSNKVQASYSNGLLTITLPKSEAVKPKQISVQVS